MSTTDRILEIIDAGLQTPEPDPTFGEISPDVDDGCTRCGVDLGDEPEHDICTDCRAFLLGDSDEDPAAPVSTPPEFGVSFAQAAEGFRRFQAQMQRVAEQMAASLNSLTERVNALPPDVKAAIEAHARDSAPTTEGDDG